MQTEFKFPELIVQADPEWVGKHPYHDHRYVTTNHRLVVEEQFSELSRPRVQFDHDAPREAAIICQMTDHPQQAAFAKLFAAAPELLEALKAINQWWESDNFSRRQDLWDQMRAAITKAEAR